MTPNTSPQKPEWFSLIENDAPSAQVRKVDKRLTVSTALAALAIAASGALFASASTTPDSSATQASATQASLTDTSALPSQSAITSDGALKMASPSIGIADPTLNGGGSDNDDEYEDDGEYEDEYEDEDGEYEDD